MAQDAIKMYYDLLERWSNKMSLFHDFSRFYTYHVPICLDVVNFVANKYGKDVAIADLGSGNGMPGIFFAMNGFSNMTLVDSHQKKITFLKYVLTTLDLPGRACCERAQTFLSNTPYDIVVARAFAPLVKLFDMIPINAPSHAKYIFLKGERMHEEIKSAKKKFNFLHTTHRWGICCFQVESLMRKANSHASSQ